MESDFSHNILEEYDKEKTKYLIFCDKLERLVNDLLEANNIKVHTVSSRVKDRSSLRRKIIKPERKYDFLSEITDILGIRIITYFADEVDHVATLVEKEFTVDIENSIDKRRLLDPDRFGYLSLHYIVTLSQERSQLPEYRSFKDFNAEIQIRSLLQHAWAEMQHDIGYQSQFSVPKVIKRRFFRIAGILELTDQEFMSLRDEIYQYEKIIPEEIKKNPNAVFLDHSSFFHFFSNNKIMMDLDGKIARELSTFPGISTFHLSDEIIDKFVRMLNYFNIYTVEELDNILRNKSELILRFAEKWGLDNTDALVIAGISLQYLHYILVAESLDESEASSFLSEFSLVRADCRSKIIQRIFHVYSTISAT